VIIRTNRWNVGGHWNLALAVTRNCPETARSRNMTARGAAAAPDPLLWMPLTVGWISVARAQNRMFGCVGGSEQDP